MSLVARCFAVAGLLGSLLLTGCASAEDVGSDSSDLTSTPDIAFFKEQATRELNAPVPPANYFERNQRINAKYAEVFLSNPKLFPWFGAAMHASHLVGVGIGLTERLGAAPEGKMSAWTKVMNAILADKPQVVRDGVHEGLSEGNINVYMNIYPATIAYKRGGLATLKSLLDRGQIDADLYRGFELAEKGDIGGSVHAILIVEQRRTLAPSFEDPDHHLDVLTAGSCMWWRGALPEICFAPWTLLHEHKRPDITDKEQRMAWVEGQVVPSWSDQMKKHLPDQLSFARKRIGMAECKALLDCDDD
jgi:hypothetical protein